MSVFGFSTEPSKGGDFTPIVKYDARAGRFFRVDRIQLADGNFDSQITDITANFKAVFDFANIEVGWIDFPVGSAPSFVLVPLGQPLPQKPTGGKHKNGLRFLIKLAKDIANDKPIREIATTSKASLSGIEAAYLQYQAEQAKYPGQLPVLVLEKTTPVRTGSGVQTSTNYHPVFKIIGWVPRGDLVPQPRTNGSGQQQSAQQDMNFGSAQAAPATGAQRAAPPAQQTVSASDFG